MLSMEEGKMGEVPVISIGSLKRDVLRDIKYLSSKGMISGTEVYNIVKSFLKKFLNLNYEFTKDELFVELKNIYLPYNVKADFFKFIENIFVFEYSKINYSEHELRSFLDEFKGYLDYLLVSKAATDKRVGEVVAKRWKNKVFSRFFGKKDVGESKDNKESKEIVKVNPILAKHTDINSLVEQIYHSLYNSDVASAKYLYMQVIELYQKLPKNEQIAYYELINSTFLSIKDSQISS